MTAAPGPGRRWPPRAPGRRIRRAAPAAGLARQGAARGTWRAARARPPARWRSSCRRTACRAVPRPPRLPRPPPPAPRRASPAPQAAAPGRFPRSASPGAGPGRTAPRRVPARGPGSRSTRRTAPRAAAATRPGVNDEAPPRPRRSTPRWRSSTRLSLSLPRDSYERAATRPFGIRVLYRQSLGGVGDEPGQVPPGWRARTGLPGVPVCPYARGRGCPYSWERGWTVCLGTRLTVCRWNAAADADGPGGHRAEQRRDRDAEYQA